VCAVPLRRPPVDLALGAVGPLDVDSDRDRVAAVADIQAFELAAPLIRHMLDRLTIHPSRVERMFECV
jgi:hypothetical protein